MSGRSPSRIQSFRFAIQGIIAAFRSEPNMRIHLLVMAITLISGWYFEITPMEWIAIVLAGGFVIATEIINTSIETLTDLVSPQQNEKAGKTKDLSAAAVLIASIVAVTTGLIIFLPRFYSLVVSG